MKSFPIVLFLLIVIYSCQHREIVNPEIKANLRDLSSDEVAISQATSEFAIELFQQLEDENVPNLFFSPFSIHQALSMTMNGDDAESLVQIRNLLKYGNMSLDEANESNRELTALLLEMDAKVKLSIANGIWFNELYTLKTHFRQTVSNYYGAEVAGLDMGNPASKDIINNWISRQTNGLLKDVLDYVDPDAMMYLVNAIYFKADWKYTFNENNTKKASFLTSSGKEVRVDMMDMNTEATYKSYVRNDIHYLELPYSTGQFNMGIVYNTTGDLQEVLPHISAANLNEWRKNSVEANFILKMPKFKMQHKINNLHNDLQEMELKQPFEAHPENFTNMFTQGPPLVISRVIHDALIEVDEKGSEAAAATVVEMMPTSAAPRTPYEVVLDKPFVFIIQERHSGAILFMGKLGDPSLL